VAKYRGGKPWRGDVLLGVAERKAEQRRRKVARQTGGTKDQTGHTHTHTTAEQTTHTNTERATAQRRLTVENKYRGEGSRGAGMAAFVQRSEKLRREDER